MPKPTPNPRRAGSRWVYALEVEARGLGHVFALVPVLRLQLVAADRLVACPVCGSTATVAHRDDRGHPLASGLLRCACGAGWSAPHDRPRVSAEWTRRTRLVSAVARAALPRSIARREAELVAAHDLEGWARLGIADAILGRRPAHIPAPNLPPWSVAYVYGFASCLTLLLAPHETRKMPNEPTPTLVDVAPSAVNPNPIPAVIAFALVAAQAAAETITRDSKNSQLGYNYASSDQISAVARRLLTDQGVAFVRYRTTAVAAALPQDMEIGNQDYIGDVLIEYALIHRSGAQWLGSATGQIVGSKARPQDKAMAAATTYTTGQILSGLLLFDREDREHAVDQRPEMTGGRPERSTPEREPQRPPRGRARKQVAEAAEQAEAKIAAPPPEPFVAANSEYRNRIVAATASIATRTGRPGTEVFRDAAIACRVPATIMHKGETLEVDRPTRLRVSEAEAVVEYLETLDGQLDERDGRAPDDLPDYVPPDEARERQPGDDDEAEPPDAFEAGLAAIGKRGRS